jgi:formate-dependent nitrite reductase membrane component NrfD
MFAIAAAGVALNLLPATALFTTIASIFSLLLIAATTGLLVWDLDRPDRFWTILVRPQWRSWLVRGAWVLIGFSAVAGLVLVGHLSGSAALWRFLTWPGVALAILAAVYTAFLFAQAEGRDLWQSALLPWHLFVQALMAGAAGLLILGLFLGLSAEAARVLAGTFGAALLLNLLLTAGGEFGVPHASVVAKAAARMITRGRYARHYWGSLLAGLLLPLTIIVLAPGSTAALALAGALSLAGLFFYEWAYVMAPQQVPNN